MKLKPIDSPELLELVAGWLGRKDITQWLDIVDGKQQLTPAWLKILTQRDTHLFRVITCDEDDTPIGVVALIGINRQFRTGHMWVAIGDSSFLGRSYGTRAFAGMLTIAFRELGLRAVSTWVVAGNHGSMKIAERCGFKPIGWQRQCHYIDGRPVDRLWFDILASEHTSSPDV